MKLEYSLVLLVLLLVPAFIEAKKCHALALEGGGDKGAYHAGAIRALVDLLPPDEVAWEVVTGVSVGSINSMGLSLFPPGSEDEASNYMLGLWRGMTKDKVFANWPQGLLYGILHEPGMYTNQPLKEYLAEITAGKSLHRKITIGTVDADRGVFLNYNESLTMPEFLKMVVASASIPLVFPFAVNNGTNYMDGGTICNIDIASAINRCRLAGYADDEIVLDMIFCKGASWTTLETGKFNSIDMHERRLEIESYEKTMWYLTNARHEFPQINFRYVIIPYNPLPAGFLSITFKADDIANMIGIGYHDATNVVNAGPSTAFNLITRHHELRRQNKAPQSFKEFLGANPELQELYKLD